MKAKKLNKKNKTIALIFVLVMYFAFSAKSQVTIGTQSQPLKGTILDLKEDPTKTTGEANSYSGMMMSRVSLTDVNSLSPILTGAEAVTMKAAYTGLIVYNVNEADPLEKGLCQWDGNQWNHLSTSALESVKAINGEFVSGSDTVLLGGNLVVNTAINLGNSNLIFMRDAGKIGIGTSKPQAIMQIDSAGGTEPLILQNVKQISDPNNFDDPNPVYYNVRISDNGVIRKANPVVSGKDNESFVYNLKGDVNGGSANVYTEINSSADTNLTWTKDGTIYPFIILPEDGTYAFSFRLYGRTGGRAYSSGIFYLTAVKNNIDFYTKDFIIFQLRTTAETNPYDPYQVATCTINITVTGAAGDHVSFKMGNKQDTGITYWRLLEGPVTAANRASMFFWRLG